MFKALSTVAATAALVLCTVSTASATPVGEPTQISDFSGSSTINSCGGPGIGTNPVNGKTLAAWTTDSGDTYSLKFTFLDEDGTGGEIFTYSSEGALIPSLSSCRPVEIGESPDGNFLIAWEADDSTRVRGVVVGANGDIVGQDFDISSNDNYNDIETLDLEWSAADERYFVAWKANVSNAFVGEAASQQLVGQFIDAAGAQLGDDFLVTNSPNGYDNSMDVAYGDGVWAVVGGHYNGNKAYVTFVEPDGTLSSAFPCSAQDSSTSSASIAYNESLNLFACVWKSAATMKGNFMSSDGSLVEGTDLELVGSTVGGKPRIVSLDVDGWFVTWHSGTGSGRTPDVNGAQIDGDGALIGDIEFLSSGVNDHLVELNFRPAVVFSAVTGHVYVTWVRYEATDKAEIYARGWFIREGEGLPESLAETGVDASGIALAAFALMAMGIFAARRRHV